MMSTEPTRSVFVALGAVLAAVPLVSGCGSAPATAHQEAAVTIDNGTTLNGRTLNGMTLNGMTLNGMTLNGMTLNGTTLNGRTLNGRTLNGGSLASAVDQLGWVERAGATLAGQHLGKLDVGAGGLAATASDGTRLGGADLIGARLYGASGIGIPVVLRIDDAHADVAPNDDIELYDVSYLWGTRWMPLCGLDDDGNRMSAVAVPGRWNLFQGVSNGGDHVADSNVFTLGCVEDAVGKCARLGYKPWVQKKSCDGRHCETLDLADWHQACTRMVRADYCGDGRSHTIDGTVINVFDGIGIQVDDQSWHFEAEWDTGGAICVAHQRVVDLTIVPGCAPRLIDPTCGDRSHFDDGTLLMDEYEVAPTRR